MKKMFALLAVAVLMAFAAPALAANPFADVPMNHWAYDAVAQLASTGCLVGYPDGSFKGPQPATRYELAAVVARCLAKVDMEKASKQDLELLKKLVVEFKSELDALGVKVDKLDSRVALLEERIGGWKFSGNFRFTAKWADDDNPYGIDGDTNWQVDRFRWNITKYVDDKVTVYARYQGGDDGSDLMYAYAAIKMPWDVTMMVGRFPLDWEADFYATDFAGYMMNDAFVTDFDPLDAAVAFKKDFEQGSFELFVAHDESAGFGSVVHNENWVWNSWGWGDALYGLEQGPDSVIEFESDRYIYGARLAFDFNEMFSMALNYVKYDYNTPGEATFYWFDDDWYFDDDYPADWHPVWESESYTYAADQATMWADVIFNFNENIALKGQYFMQDNDPLWQIGHSNYEDDPAAWKAILTFSQDLLGFTDLWLEYAQIDAGFVFSGVTPYAWTNADFFVDDFGRTIDDTTVINVVAKQKWNDQWWTYVRYADFDVDNYGDYQNWTASVRYNYTPNMWFELGFDKYNGDLSDLYENDSMVWFRTVVNF